MLDVATIGNATLIAYEDRPVLVTDPWLGGDCLAYFGSWGLSHEIPKDLREDIDRADYIWFSHGHPDHLNPDSLKYLKGRKILLGDHVGGRMEEELRNEGFEVEILPDREWVQLSPHIKVMCLTTWIQDSVLLVDVNGRLFVNLNDARDQDCTVTLRRIIKRYEHSYLLSLCACHDADMLNFWTEDGTFILPPSINREPAGLKLTQLVERMGTTAAVPFSSFHTYKRADSKWAQEYARTHDEYTIGFNHEKYDFVPAFSRIDCVTGEVTAIDPPESPDEARPPSDFGDDWSDELEKEDVRKIEAYFRRRITVRDNFRFLTFRVGAKEHRIDLDGKVDRGSTFETPRHSLMSAIDWEVFDDLLIGNFMKTTLHNIESLYDAGFVYATAKWGDNGRAFTYEELAEYTKEYKRRAGLDWFYSRYYEYPLMSAALRLRKAMPTEGPAYEAAAKVYRWLT